MKAIIVLSMLVAVGLAMPHEFAAQQPSNPAELIRRNKALLSRVEKDVKAQNTLASKKLRLPKKQQQSRGLTLGAPVTFESYATDMMCGSTPGFSVKLNVGECKDVTGSFAINITDWVQPPIHNREPADLCSSIIHHDRENCEGERSLLTFEVKKCQAGNFWANWNEIAGEALEIHSGCDAKKVTDEFCRTCNTTTHAIFEKCAEIPLLGSIKARKVEKCNPVRLNLLTSCSGGTLYDSYVLGQGKCFAGMMVKDGHF